MNNKLLQKKEIIKNGYPFNICFPIMKEKITISEVNPPFDCVNEVNTSKCKDHTYRDGSFIGICRKSDEKKCGKYSRGITELLGFGGNTFRSITGSRKKCKNLNDDIRVWAIDIDKKKLFLTINLEKDNVIDIGDSTKKITSIDIKKQTTKSFVVEYDENYIIQKIVMVNNLPHINIKTLGGYNNKVPRYNINIEEHNNLGKEAYRNFKYYQWYSLATADGHRTILTVPKWVNQENVNKYGGKSKNKSKNRFKTKKKKIKKTN